MLNIARTKEVFGYEVSLERTRRTTEDVAATNGIQPKNLDVIDNCPQCSVERIIKLRQSRKNIPCSKCFHNSPEMIKAKQNQKKEKSEEHKQKMRDNHWSKKGGISAFKGKKQSKEAKELIREKKIEQFSNYSEEYLKELKIKESCTKRGISVEEFSGFSAPEGTRIRQSAEGKAWSYDVLSKSNFTCIKCSQRGGKLHAHHLNSFNAFPEQRFDVENGACLCKNCHQGFHSIYGKGNNTKIQFKEWLSGTEG